MSNIVQLQGVPSTANIGRKVDYHPDYLDIVNKWSKMRHCYNNQVIENAHKYLITPPGMTNPAFTEKQLSPLEKSIAQLSTKVARGSSWNALQIKYAAEGTVPSLISFTGRGYSALALEHDPVMEFPKQMEYLKDNATKDGIPLTEIFGKIVIQSLLFGRCPTVLDIDDNGKIKIVLYPAESLINWEAKASPSTDNQFFEWAIFKDYEVNEKYDPIDATNEPRYLEVITKHYLDNGIYTVTKYHYDGTMTTVVPKYLGKVLNFVPVTAIGSLDNSPDVDIIPMEGIADCEIRIYNLSCMLAHAESTSCVPTFYMTGVDEDEVPPVTGAGVVIALADSQARVGYTTTDTSAMSHILARMADQYMQAQEQGSNLLGSRKNSSESGEALRLRQASVTASLKSVVNNVGIGINTILKQIASWMSIKEDIRFEPNKEFSTFSLTANETIALVQSWQAGAISHSTLLNNFLKAGILVPGETEQDEIDKLSDPGEKYEDPDKEIEGLDIGEGLPKSNTMNKAV